MKDEIQAYNDLQTANDKAICDKLRSEIDKGLPKAESKIWHAHLKRKGQLDRLK